MSTIRFYLILLLIVLASQSAAQNGERWYYNIDADNIAIQGYDLVSYFEQNKAIIGSKDFQTTFKGVNYLFSNQDNKIKFENNPESFIPAYGGWCAYAAALDLTKDGYPSSRFPIDPTHFKITDGRLLLFAKLPNFDGLHAWNKADEKLLLQQADLFWESREKLAKLNDGLPKGMNPNARMENLMWQKLMGTWKGEVQWMTDTVTKQYSPKISATWKFYYGYKGYCIQDDWFPDQYFAGNGIWAGPAIRGYDPMADEWHMTYIPINSSRNSTWMMTATFNENGDLEGRMVSTDPNGDAFIQRIFFYDITPNQFLWRADRTYNNGKTWIKDVGKSVQTRLELP